MITGCNPTKHNKGEKKMKQMKKITSMLIVLLMALSVFTPAIAAEGITVKIDGTPLNFDVPPTEISGRVMVPVRVIFEALGATVEWVAETKAVNAKKDDIAITLFIDNTTMYVNGNEKKLDVPAKEISGRTLVPVRAISEAFGNEVGWDGNRNTVSILKDEVNYQMLYTEDGRAFIYHLSDVAAQLEQGWLTERIVDVSANISQITDFINRGLYLEAIQECDNLKSYKMKDSDAAKINELRATAQSKYDAYEQAEKDKMIDVYASILLRQYHSRMKDPSSFVLNAVYAGFDSSIYSNYDFVAVVDVSGRNSFGAMNRSVYTMLLKTDEGKYILDLKDYADDMADSSWGGSKVAWMDIAINALKIQSNASKQLKRLDTDFITRLVLSK